MRVFLRALVRNGFGLEREGKTTGPVASEGFLENLDAFV